MQLFAQSRGCGSGTHRHGPYGGSASKNGNRLRSFRRLHRDFQPLPANEAMQLLNGYFDTVVLAIAGKGDEVLRLMGDAVRAFFPVTGRHGGGCCLPGSDGNPGKKRRQRKSPQGNRAWGVALHRREVSYVISLLSAVSIHADWPRPQHGDGRNCLCRHLS